MAVFSFTLPVSFIKEMTVQYRLQIKTLLFSEFDMDLGPRENIQKYIEIVYRENLSYKSLFLRNG